MDKVKLNEWTQWFKFNDLFEYHGLIWQKGDLGKDSTRDHKIFTHLDKTGTLHTDDGFRLRSHYDARTSFPKETKISLDEVKCPLLRGMVGCYHIKILHNHKQWDYIGQCSETKDGMRKRITHHFRKICNIPDHPSQPELSEKERYTQRDASARGMSEGESRDIKFKDLGKKFLDKYNIDPSNPEDIFWDHVQIRFVYVDHKKKNFKKMIEKIEGLAIITFCYENEGPPKLNSKNEILGMANFSEKVDNFLKRIRK
jgi:hypothetical protein